MSMKEKEKKIQDMQKWVTFISFYILLGVLYTPLSVQSLPTFGGLLGAIAGGINIQIGGHAHGGHGLVGPSTAILGGGTHHHGSVDVHVEGSGGGGTGFIPPPPPPPPMHRGGGIVDLNIGGGSESLVDLHVNSVPHPPPPPVVHNIQTIKNVHNSVKVTSPPPQIVPNRVPYLPPSPPDTRIPPVPSIPPSTPSFSSSTESLSMQSESSNTIPLPIPNPMISPIHPNSMSPTTTSTTTTTVPGATMTTLPNGSRTGINVKSVEDPGQINKSYSNGNTMETKSAFNDGAFSVYSQASSLKESGSKFMFILICTMISFLFLH